MNVLVTPKDGAALLDWGAGARRAAVGRSGIGVKRREGDGVTPLGTYPLRRLYWRADRIEWLVTGLPIKAIARDDGWCDAPGDPNYNRLVKRPYAASSETLWRDDGLYDLLVTIGFNDDPVVDGAGSAIFLHAARPDYGPTEGCIALAKADLLELLMRLAPGDTLTAAL
ncbi:MAG: L,D-transpeptidase family protein [Proteobacteria bacterium]|nr:L,D-transpeptidase family protein [Pseudomonadota bacterium]